MSESQPPSANIPPRHAEQTIVPSADLSPDELAALEQRYLEEHAGHEQQHAQMAMILFACLIFSQIGIMIWKKYHVRSFNLLTLLGLWLVPPAMALNMGNWRYITIWACFSVINGLVLSKVMENPMKSTTPKIVYRWFQKVYSVSYAVGITGYVIVLLTFLHVLAIVGVSADTEVKFFETGVILLFYGLYFGTLSRDLVDRLSDAMAIRVGYYSKSGFPAKHLRQSMCAICGDSTTNSTEKLHSLNCGHTYHELCIRGWTILGKKDICPYCKEKVDMKSFRNNPWDTQQQLYLSLLDGLRYLVVWNPVVFLLVHFVFELLGLK
ncbi:hypothetical protein HDU85_001721 [Gaertneriomyces sp. JEL0708]|nr:hypothetical protein HDU85_001721 [Gaertneriomyces sp. JEL0708]